MLAPENLVYWNEISDCVSSAVKKKDHAVDEGQFNAPDPGVR